MKLQRSETKYDFVYRIEIENVIYNRSNLDEDIVDIVGENFASRIIDDMQENSKYIRSSLKIDDFEVVFVGVNQPIVLLEFSCNLLIDDDTLNSVLGRYTTRSYEEEFQVDGESEKVAFKPVREGLKIYLSSEDTAYEEE